MSSGWGGGYDYERARREAAAREARRRALVEELERVRRARQQALEIAKAQKHAGAQIDTDSSRVSVDESDVSSLEKGIRDVVAETDRLVRSTAAGVAALERGRTLGALAAGVSGQPAVTAAEALGAHPVAATPQLTVGQLDTVEGLLSQLDPDQAHEQAGLLDLVGRIPAATPDMQRSFLAELKVRIDRLNAAAESRRASVETARDLHLQLAGVDSPVADELRRRLDAVIHDEAPLDTGLRSQVESEIEHDHQRLVRAQVIVALRDSLTELGYTVGAEFVTDLGSSGVAYVSRAGWTDHELEVVVPEDGGVMALTPVRTNATAGSGTASRQRDIEIEREFCDGLDQFEARMDDSGIRVPTTKRFPPGHHAMRVVSGDDGNEQRRRRSQRNDRVQEA